MKEEERKDKGEKERERENEESHIEKKKCEHNGKQESYIVVPFLSVSSFSHPSFFNRSVRVA